MLAARIAFDRDGRIPTDIAARLMQHGVIVSRLEDQWTLWQCHVVYGGLEFRRIADTP